MLGSMMRRAMIGDDAKLSLDFTSTLPAGVTFTRAANTATRINSSGLVETMSADQPRFDHDPTTGSPRGLLIEGSATNVALNSDVMRGTGWAVTNLLTPSNAAGVTDPANGTNSTNYIANGTTGYHFSGVVSTTTGASTTAVTWSCWVRANGYTKVLMAEGNSGRGAVSFDIDPNNTTPPAPTVVGGAGSPTGTITRYPNNWYRIAMRVGVASSTAYQWNVVGYPTGATLGNFGAQYTGDSTSGIYVWGAMLEDGSGASSYIPTGASQATRNPDICTISGAAFSSWYNASEGTFFAHFRRRRTDNTGAVLSANDNTTAEVIELAADTAGKFNITDGGASQVALFRTPFSANTDTKIAGAFKLNDCNMAMANSIAGGDATATIPTVDRLFIGRDSGAVPVYLDGHIKTIKFYDIRKDDGKLQEMTA